MSTAVPARTNRSGSASPAMRCRPETSCLRQPARGQTHTSPCALSADRQRSGTQLLWIEQQSQAGPLVGSKPESMIVPRGARRSDQKAHPSRLEQARRFLPSWSRIRQMAHRNRENSRESQWALSVSPYPVQPCRRMACAPCAAATSISAPMRRASSTSRQISRTGRRSCAGSPASVCCMSSSM
jgi:hypothetical protein